MPNAASFTASTWRFRPAASPSSWAPTDRANPPCSKDCRASRRPTAAWSCSISRDIARLPSAEVARRLAVLPQMPEVPERMTVLELVEQGRFPHVGALGMLRRQDSEAVHDALALTGMTVLAHRALEQLSGGERQRAWIALALAQATPWLLLDEPTTFLDIGHQFEVLHLIQRLNRERGITIVMVLHDLGQAARFADRMVVLANGRVHSDGEPASVLTPTMLAEVFGIEARVLHDPESRWPIIVPLRPLPNGPTSS